MARKLGFQTTGGMAESGPPIFTGRIFCLMETVCLARKSLGMSLFTLKTGDQQQYGPVEMETLRTWTREGRIKENDSIYDHTHLKWVEASRIPQIMDLFHSESADFSRPSGTPAQAKEAPFKMEAEGASEQVGRESAAETTPAKAAAGPQLTPRPLSSSARLKIQQSLKQGEQTTGADGQAQPAAIRPPTVLDRISRIFLLPFTRKKTDTDPSRNK